MNGFIYSPGKARRSGSSMQKMPLRGSLKRANEVRRVSEGFPWRSQFSSRQEVDEYLNRERITCLICGREFSVIGHLHLRIHNITVDDYKIKFGIPLTLGLTSQGVKEKKRANLLKLQEEGKMLPSHIYHPPKNKARKPPPYELRAMPQRIKGGRGVTYEDFSWHLEIGAKVYAYRSVEPPEGICSWSGFKKRRNSDSELRSFWNKARENVERKYKRQGRQGKVIYEG